MSRAICTLFALALLALAAGCGSSGSPSSVSSHASTTTGPSASNGDRFEVITTPKFLTPSASLPVHSGVVQVVFSDIAIHPSTLRVKAGSTVRWINDDPVPCNVTSEGGPQSFASKNFGSGQTFEVKLTKPGLIRYECTLYPASMNGAIAVVE